MQSNCKIFIATPKRKELLIINTLAIYYNLSFKSLDNMILYNSSSYTNLLKFINTLFYFQVRTNKQISNVKNLTNRKIQILNLELEEKKILPSKIGPRYSQKRILRLSKGLKLRGLFVSPTSIKLKNLFLGGVILKENYLDFKFFFMNFVAKINSCGFYVDFFSYVLFLRVV